MLLLELYLSTLPPTEEGVLHPPTEEGVLHHSQLIFEEHKFALHQSLGENICNLAFELCP